jgi:hypothetical protein
MRVVAALATVAALLAAFVLLVDRNRPGAVGTRREHARLVDGFNRASVRRLTIARTGAASFSLVRQPPGGDPAWRVAPGDGAADTAAVEDLLAAIDLAESERTADLTPTAAGLAPPAVTIDLDTGGAPLSVRLGRADAAVGVFVAVGAQAAIRVGPRRLLDLADRAVGAYAPSPARP